MGRVTDTSNPLYYFTLIFSLSQFLVVTNYLSNYSGKILFFSGSLFTRQWPKIPHIFEAENEDFLELCEAHVLVSEKLG